MRKVIAAVSVAAVYLLSFGAAVAAAAPKHL